jgi:DNA-3-methyladenine glycosylase II
MNLLCRMNLENAISHLKTEPNIRPLIEAVAVPDFKPSGRIYYDLLESIVSQQLSVKVADVIFKRFLTLFPDQYPHPEQLCAIEIERLRSVGLSNQKANYLQNVARFSLENDLENHNWDGLSDEEIIQFLTQIKGVGKWTVQMLLMFTIGRLDIFPVDDLGIQQAMTRLFGLDTKDKQFKNNMMARAEIWRPYRTIACRYLWRWKDSVNKTLLAQS